MSKATLKLNDGAIRSTRNEEFFYAIRCSAPTASAPSFNLFKTFTVWTAKSAPVAAYSIALLPAAEIPMDSQRAPTARSGSPATHGPLFVFLLPSVITVVTLLQFLPALALGPVAEHLLVASGRTF